MRSLEELCRGIPNCFTLAFKDASPDAIPEEVAKIRDAPQVRVRRGDTATFILTFDGVQMPWQYGLGSTIVTFYDDGTKAEGAKYATPPGAAPLS
jgi:hypothetical protein